MQQRSLFPFVALFLTARIAAAQESAMDALYQLAPWKAVTRGLYQGFSACSDVLARGDFGFMIFEALDGEGVVLDGVPYRFLPDGAMTSVPATNTVCFALVKVFEANQSGIRAEELSLTDLKNTIDAMLQTKNLPVAIKVDGDFAAVTLAALSKQVSPYPPLEQALEQQHTQTLKNVTGTLVGFRLPAYFGETLPPGYRFYFVKRDKTIGGRVLDLRVRNLRFDFDYSPRLHLDLPAWGEFYAMP